MFNRKYKMAIKCVENRIDYYQDLAMWAKENSLDRYDVYIARIIALKEVLGDINSGRKYIFPDLLPLKKF